MFGNVKTLRELFEIELRRLRRRKDAGRQGHTFDARVRFVAGVAQRAPESLE